MSDFSDFTQEASPELTDHVVGYRTATSGGEQRTLLSAIKALLQSQANTTLKAAERNSEGVITVSGVQLDTAQATTLAEGQLRWNDSDKCVEFGVSATESISIGQELAIRARNATGSTLVNGAVVYVSGATGNRPTVTLARADTLVTTQKVIGCVTNSEGIPNNNDGRVTVFGIVNDLDTSAYAEGTELFLSAATAGTLTATAPSAEGQFLNRVGVVTRSHATQGAILVHSEYRGSVTGNAVHSAASQAAARAALSVPSTAEVSTAITTERTAVRTLTNADLSDPSNTLDPVQLTSAAFGNRNQSRYIYDDFSVDRDPIRNTLTPTGQTWGVVGPQQLTAYVADGKLQGPTEVDPDDQNFYSYLDYGADVPSTGVPRVSGVFSYTRSASGTNEVDSNSATLLVYKDVTVDGGLDDMLHMRVWLSGWVLEKVVTGGSNFVAIASGNHTLQFDTQYAMALEIDGDTVRVFPPQGPMVEVTDSELLDIQPLRYGSWQCNRKTNSPVSAWHFVSMGAAQGRRQAAEIGSATIRDVDFLMGRLTTRKRQRVEFTSTTTNEWYKVASVVSWGTNWILGRVKVSAKTSTTKGNVAEFLVGSQATGTPYIRQVYGQSRTGTVFTQARISNNGSGGDDSSQLDLYIADNAADVIVEFEGLFEPITAPVAGATALGGTTKTINIVGASAISGALTAFGPTNLLERSGSATSPTLTPGTSPTTLYFTDALTATRNVTLSTTGVWGGARFRVVRSAAATGAFDVNVGGIKVLDPGEWVDVEYSETSAAWFVTGFGSL